MDIVNYLCLVEAVSNREYKLSKLDAPKISIQSKRRPQ